MNEYRDNNDEAIDKTMQPNELKLGAKFERRSLIFMAFINVGK